MKNKQEQIKSLTWKYFWQQKIAEVSILIIFLFTLILAPYILGHAIGDNKSVACGENGIFFSEGQEEVDCSSLNQWFEGVLYIIIGSGGILLVFIILHGWIENNWAKAKRRANKELNPKKKK